MATLKDIARRAGVSIGTVDRIIHDRGRYSADTAEKVRKIMEETDYRPNVMARHLSKSVTCRLAALVPEPGQDSGYWDLPLAGMRRAERELAPFGLSLEVIEYDRFREDGLTEAGERLLGRDDIDGLLMAPMREQEARGLLGRLDSKLPVVFFDTDIPGSDRMSYIGQDSYASGRLGARLTAMAARGGGRYLIVAPIEPNEHLESRMRGFYDGVGGAADVMRNTVESDHDERRFTEILDSLVSPDTAGIFVVNASTHYTAEYLAGKKQRVPLVGYDLVPGNRKWLEAGVIDFLLTQRPVQQGYRSVRYLFRKLVMGEVCPDHEYTPIDIVARENLEYLADEEIQ